MEENTSYWNRQLRTASSRVESTIKRIGNDAISSSPAAHRPIMELWGLYVLAYGKTQAWASTFRFRSRAPIDPFAVVRVDPNRIEFLVEGNGYPAQTLDGRVFPGLKFKHAGRVVGGDWDVLDRRFEETELYRSFEAHFNRDVPWQETPFYRRAIDYIEAGITLWGCDSEAEFARRCRYVDSLYETIETDGYRSQRELTSGAIRRGVPSDFVGLVNHEIAVCVSRSGELLFLDGRNRLAIAKVLGLESIPVWIVVRHEDWQRYRDRLASDPARCRELPADRRDHPDLRDIC